jgi:hypothetical protein
MILIIKRVNSDSLTSAWMVARKMLEMSHASIKKFYPIGEVREIEMLILKERLIDQLNDQKFKQYTGEDVSLTFCPFDINEATWFVNCVESYNENRISFLISEVVEDLKTQIKRNLLKDLKE